MSVGDEWKKVEKPVVMYARERGCMTLKINVLGKKGFPDHFIFCPGGKLLMIEFKTLHGRLSKIQQYIHAKLRALQWPVHVVRTAEQGKQLIDEALDGKR